MAERLRLVEESLRTVWKDSGTDQDFGSWCGLNEPTIGWRSQQGYHGSGSAVDLNYSTCPYIVTRTGSTLGGEAGWKAVPGYLEMQQRVVDVYDRAMSLVYPAGTLADVSIRVHDTIEVTYDRFRAVSDALVMYFSWAFSAVPTKVDRAPIPGVQDLPDGDPGFDSVGDGELIRSADEAIGLLTDWMSGDEWLSGHPDWPTSPEEQYWQLRRDYELVRVPMLYGKPTQPIRSTRNPARGMLDLAREVVTTLVNVGNTDQIHVRWGASDFGSAESGDIQHFDLGQNAGYQSE
jgi:hypothetical protein